MTKKITVIDYEVGNLLSVTRAFEHFNVAIQVTSNPQDIQNADYLVLPGVGAFKQAMQKINDLNLAQPILEFTKKQRPFLGICLGMQMMLQTSVEFGKHQGLGIIEGEVLEIPKITESGKPHKIPHIGWTEITNPQSDQNWNTSILKGIPQNTPFYFVHSFTAHPTHQQNRLADASYNGQLISAVVSKDHLYGCQFHPEKSGENGLKIINNFIEL